MFYLVIDIYLSTLGVGAAVEIAAVTGTIALVIGILVGVLLFYCINKLRSQSPNPESFLQQQQQAGPLYEQVLATSGEGELELRENVAYGPVQRIELRENVAYGPVQH